MSAVVQQTGNTSLDAHDTSREDAERQRKLDELEQRSRELKERFDKLMEQKRQEEEHLQVAEASEKHSADGETKEPSEHAKDHAGRLIGESLTNMKERIEAKIEELEREGQEEAARLEELRDRIDNLQQPHAGRSIGRALE